MYLKTFHLSQLQEECPSMTKMSAKLNMSSLDLSHTIPEDLDIFLSGSTFVDRGILFLSSKENTRQRLRLKDQDRQLYRMTNGITSNNKNGFSN
jgi:hypothetical protein